MGRQTAKIIRDNKIVVILRALSMEKVIWTISAMREGGIRCVEITFNQASKTCIDDTTSSIREAIKRFPDMCIGAGTVITAEELEAAYDAGARYIVTPNTDIEIIKRAKELGITVMAGAMTPTEAEGAYRAGADFVKIFPVDNLGSAYIKAITAPLNHIPVTAVGGVNLDNMEEFYRAGVCGFGIGGCIADKKMIEAEDFQGLKNLAEAYVKKAGTLGQD